MSFTKLVTSDKIKHKVEGMFLVVRRKIKTLVPQSQVIHVGGSSVPGLLTKGDLDIQVRVDIMDFPQVIASLGGEYVEHNQHLWTDYYAIFKDEDSFGEKIDILVTAKNYPEDVYHLYTKVLKKHPELVAEFNQIKQSFKEYHSFDYKQAKGEFFSKLRTYIRK